MILIGTLDSVELLCCLHCAKKIVNSCHNAFHDRSYSGLSCLKKMNPELHRAVANAGLPLRNIRSRAKPWFSGSEPFSTLLELNLEQEIKKAGGEAEEGLIIDGEVMATTIMRGALQVSEGNFEIMRITCVFYANMYVMNLFIVSFPTSHTATRKYYWISFPMKRPNESNSESV